MQAMEQRLGARLGYRVGLERHIARHLEAIDFLEVLTDQLLDADPDGIARLQDLRRDKVVLAHGAEMSLGTDMAVDETYLDSVAELAGKLDCPWQSEHLGFSKVLDTDVGQRLPLWFTDEALEVVRRNVRQVRERMARPLLLENITYYFHLPGDQMSEAAFLSRALQDTDSGLLLDLNNLHINSLNLGFDPYDFLSCIPLERVVEVHIAGGHPVFGLVVDTHGSRVHDEVWLMLEYVVRHTPVRGVVLEWDQDFPPFQVLLDHLTHVRTIQRRFGARPAGAH